MGPEGLTTYVSSVPQYQPFSCCLEKKLLRGPMKFSPKGESSDKNKMQDVALAQSVGSRDMLADLSGHGSG